MRLTSASKLKKFPLYCLKRKQELILNAKISKLL
ncbi:TPA: cysteine-rich KTR domain-containing protein [Listeria monocytogenes]